MPAFPYCRATLTAPKPRDPRYPSEIKTLGDHLRARRLDLGLQVKDVAARFGCREETIINWETRGLTPAVSWMPKILGFLGYDPTGEPGREAPLATRLAARRRKLGLSQAKLAAALGVHEDTLRRWEAGAHGVCAPFLAWLEGFLSHTLE